jgi:hypothetical protein
MAAHSRHLRRRIESLQLRIRALGALRKLVALPEKGDITARQWAVLESQLSVVVQRLLSRLKRHAAEYFAERHDPGAAGRLNARLGRLELDLSRSFTFFDTYSDVLTQRATPTLGSLLAGCDVLAWDALKKDHPSLDVVEPPVVHCDRGFGARIIRESVRFPGATPNPMPLIQIPYSRLKEKYNLTSIHHEAGHQALKRTGLQESIPKAFGAALARAGAPESLRQLFSLWSSEIGPDFWAFCSTGLAQPAATREILALPPADVLHVSGVDPHPPPYLRVLLSMEWARQLWGRGPWDRWEREWERCYPLGEARGPSRQVLEEGKTWLPVVARTLLNTRFRVLDGRTIPDLFDLGAVAPTRLKAAAATAGRGRLELAGLSPSAQLAVFRVVREESGISEEALDRVMSTWLRTLGERRQMMN